MKDKKKMLIIGIMMNSAGTEKAFLSMMNELDFDRYDVELLLAKKEGLLMDLIPKQIKVTGPIDYSDMFLLSSKNASQTILRSFVKKNPLVLFEILPYFVKIILSPGTKSFTATRLWCRLLRKFKPVSGEYDIAVAFWGDRTMFYMCDKVKAKKKIAWLHFDYSFPPRDDELYIRYFRQCDYIVNVSSACHNALVSKLPEIKDKCVMIENINSPSMIREMAKCGDTFTDTAFDGIRIVTVARICEQKGSDFIVPVLARLKEEGYNIRWYMVGGGDPAEVEKLKTSAEAAGVSDSLILLGATVNPYRYISDADIFALPSRYEGKPITIEEAKMLCKPIVVSNYLSASEQLDGGRYGIITEIGTEGLYSGIKRMLDSPELAEQFTAVLESCSFGNEKEIEKFYKMCSDTDYVYDANCE